MEHVLHALVHALEHSALEALTLIPFLYLTYFCMELLERRAGERTERIISRAGKAGPLLGALLGVVPQCGFSAAGAGLYAARLVSTGTLIAIFLSTSDEMLPLLLSAGAPPAKILTILGIKVAIACAAGFAIDGVARLCRKSPGEHEHDHSEHIGELCRSGHCDCDHRAAWLAALIHTARIALTVFAVSTVLHLAVELIGQEVLGEAMSRIPLLGCVLGALVGLIPNCASSVAITTLYLGGVISAGTMLAGLLVGAGTGLLVLARINRPLRDTLRVVALLLGIGIAAGLLVDLTGVGALLGI
jgi:hypothetical protein